MIEKKTRNVEKTRALILQAAADLLCQTGFSGLKVNHLAAKAGIGKPLIYRYFGSLDAVLDALAEAKAGEVAGTLRGQIPPKDSQISEIIYRQVMFARVLAGDAVLRALFRALLSGDLGRAAAGALEALAPRSGAKGDTGAAEAFLLAGISYVLMLRDSQGECSGIPIKTPNDLAAFERAFVQLATQVSGETQ